MPKQLRHLFAICCVFNTPTNALAVWEEFRLHFIQEFLHRNGLSLSNFNLPNYDDALLQEYDENFIITALDNIDNLVNVVESVNLLNIEQQQIYNDVLHFINTNNGKRLIFIDAPGGTGKTFLLKHINASLVVNFNQNIVCTAWTGIAACLLPNGATAHSIFKLPIPLFPESTINVTNNSEYAKKIT